MLYVLGVYFNLKTNTDTWFLFKRSYVMKNLPPSWTPNSKELRLRVSCASLVCVFFYFIQIGTSYTTAMTLSFLLFCFLKVSNIRFFHMSKYKSGLFLIVEWYSFDNMYIGAQLYPFICKLSMSAFLLSKQSWIVEQRSYGLQSLKIIWPFTEKSLTAIVLECEFLEAKCFVHLSTSLFPAPTIVLGTY